MEAKRWTLGVMLVAAVSLFGLVQADASPFSSYILSDDLGNSVSGTVPEASSWEDEAGSQDGTDEGNSGGDDTTGSSSSGGTDNASDTGDDASGGVENDGHGNNVDGVDSSNRGQGQGGPTGADDASCPEGGECVDDEMVKGNKKK